MKTQQQNSRFNLSFTSGSIMLSLIILFGCWHPVPAQQKDGEATNGAANESTNATSGRVNFNIIQLLNGEYLEMFGAGTSHGILRGHPSISAIELGSLSADPLIFSTNSTERMRINANGFISVGTTNQGAPLEFYAPDANPYLPNQTSAARVRFINSTTTASNGFEIDLGAFDSSGVPSSGVRLIGMLTSKTPNATSGDFVIGLRSAGTIFESARFTSNGNVGIGTNAPAYKLEVAGPIRSSSGGFVFPDGTVQTTAGGGAGGGSQWVTSGTNIYYNAGNVGIGTSTPGVALDVAQNKAIRVGNAVLSSGGERVHLATHAWFSGSAWQFDGSPGALYQTDGQRHLWWSHNGSSFTNLMFLNESGNLGLGTTSPSTRLHINGGRISLASNPGDVPFQLYSYQNSDSLWLTSGNATKSEINLSTGYAVDYDRSIALQYIPGTTGATAGVLNIGQMGKNAATYTHGTTVFLTNGLERLRINSAGNVGIGTASPAAKLDVAGQIRSSSGGFVFPDGTVQTTAGGGTSSQWTTSGANIYYTTGSVGVGTTAPTEKLEVAGNIKVSGNINAKYQDVAEWVPSDAQLPAGTVVVLDPSKSNQVVSSTTSYDTRVAGVISTQPGITLGEKSDNKVLVATSGRVRVKVDATNAPVQIGDLLVTGEREGFAMKSLPVEIGGARIHRPGTLIGKALEPLASGTGEILVLLSLQ
jgi:hypothetical protein